MKDMLMTFWKDESGQDLAEYALLLGLITIALVVIVTAFGETIVGIFQTADDTLSGVAVE